LRLTAVAFAEFDTGNQAATRWAILTTAIAA